MDGQRVRKALKNRVYAQKSRDRHRAYVVKLEEERDALMERVAQLECQQQQLLAFMQGASGREDSVRDAGSAVFKTPLSSSCLLSGFLSTGDPSASTEMTDMTEMTEMTDINRNIKPSHGTGHPSGGFLSAWNARAHDNVPPVLLALQCPPDAADSPSLTVPVDTLLVSRPGRVNEMSWRRGRRCGAGSKTRLRASTWERVLRGSRSRWIE